MKLSNLVIFIASLFLASCSYMLDWSPGDLITTKDGTKDSFSEKTKIDASTIQTSVLKSCKECHSGQKQPMLATLDDIRANIGSVVDEVNGNRMPPARVGGPLSDCQKKILEAWVNAGMPDSATQTVADLGEVCGGTVKPPNNPPMPPEPPVVPPPSGSESILNLPLNYETLAEKIIKPRCTHCHKEDGEASDYLLFPYDVLVAQTDIIGPTAKDSSLFQVVTAPDSDRMPPSDDSGPLSADEIEFIRRWIEAGHPEK